MLAGIIGLDRADRFGRGRGLDVVVRDPLVDIRRSGIRRGIVRRVCGPGRFLEFWGDCEPGIGRFARRFENDPGLLRRIDGRFCVDLVQSRFDGVASDVFAGTHADPGCFGRRVADGS
jgi:hypothetical protein